MPTFVDFIGSLKSPSPDNLPELAVKSTFHLTLTGGVEKDWRTSSSYAFMISPQFFILSMAKAGEFSRAALLYWKAMRLPAKLYKADVATSRMISAIRSKDLNYGPMIYPFSNVHLMNIGDGSWGWEQLESFCSGLPH